jgi:hypothetical protein
MLQITERRHRNANPKLNRKLPTIPLDLDDAAKGA